MLKEIKHQFLAYRNGIIADSLRSAGYPYGIIFGLQVPQLGEIAKSQPPSMELADALWADANVRESRLLACWLFPAEEMTPEKTLSLIKSVKTQEEGDILIFRLLRRLPFIKEVKATLGESDSERYVIKALERFEI